MSQTYRRGQRVMVQLDRHDEPREAVVKKAPPFTERMPGDTPDRRRDDALLVSYPGTTSSIPLFGDIQEVVDLDDVDPA